LVLFLCVALAGCSRTVDGAPAAATRGPAAGGPIQPAQLPDLLTPSLSLSVGADGPLAEQDLQSSLFAGANPAGCQGVVGYGHYPLFPTNYTGREARTQTDGVANTHQLLEVSATYPSAFNASGFLESVRRTVSGCQFPVIAWGDDEQKVTVTPGPLIPGSPDVAHWTTNLSGQQWLCDFAVIAKANVVSQIATCSTDHSIDNQALVTKRLKKIDELLNATA
jgi:hypothetical protein